jgi:hypothetical protein
METPRRQDRAPVRDANTGVQNFTLKFRTGDFAPSK